MLPSVVTAKGGHSECAPFCVFALHSYLECTKGRMGYKILQSYLQVVICLKMWQQFEFGFLTGSNPAPPNLLKLTLASPVWNTGDKLVNIISMKGQNEVVCAYVFIIFIIFGILVGVEY